MSLPTVIFERGDSLYLVGPVAPIELSAENADELAFASDLKKFAPNEHIGWLRGQYVEADRPNANGHLWSSNELAIKSLTPMLMPVTVMHDPRTAVGMIADTRLRLPGDDAEVARARIDTTLGIWRHRFAPVWEEIQANYAQGELMQSMECKAPWYDCAECGRTFPKLPGGAEQKNWCEHLSAAERPVRRLGDVTFTGTGLIFGTRGARGALDTAHLDLFQDEVAEFHERAHRDAKPRRTSSMDTIEIKRSEYDELQAKAGKVDELNTRATAAEEKAADLHKDVERLEVEKKAVETERDEHKAKREGLEETARAVTLATERMGKLGSKFTKALPESIGERLEEQAKTLSEDDWKARLDELAELTKVKPDEQAEEADDTFTEEETARAQTEPANGNGGSGAPSLQRRQAVIGGLASVLSPNKSTTETAA
jgi:hypothetical protein